MAGRGSAARRANALVSRGLDYVVAVRGDTSAHPGEAVPTAPEREGRMGAPRLPRYREPACSLKDLVTNAGRRRLRHCTWRQGSKGAMTSRFIVLEVRPAGVAATKAARDRAGGRGEWDGVLPAETLIAEWPPHQDEPTDYWLTSLPADPSAWPVRWARRMLSHRERQCAGSSPLARTYPYTVRQVGSPRPLCASESEAVQAPERCATRVPAAGCRDPAINSGQQTAARYTSCRLRQLDPQGAKECAAAVRELGDDPRPPQARQLGGFAYWRLSAGDWRILYEPEDETVTVLALKVGRVF
ncbi:transposase [Streptomyces sp. RKCA744]|uniref:transposase n=1 Tax=Streptomyces sp. RKCA744 TaxID=2959340 RepID=UPI0027E22A92|nr:transposase [Streptomyces sp. RKCA744]